MYLGDPDESLQADITDCNHNHDGVKKKSPTPAQCRNGAVTEQKLGASVRQQWLPGLVDVDNNAVNSYFFCI